MGYESGLGATLCMVNAQVCGRDEARRQKLRHPEGQFEDREPQNHSALSLDHRTNLPYGEQEYRRYASDTVQLVGYTRLAQRLGISLAESGESLPALWDAPEPEAALARPLMDKMGASIHASKNCRICAQA